MGNTYKDLIVWQKSMDLVEMIYKLTNQFPKEELYGLSSQMKRSAVSIPSNIAEGKLRRTTLDCRKFFYNAYASGAELETQLELTKRLYPDFKADVLAIESLMTEVMKMLNTLTQKMDLAPNA